MTSKFHLLYEDSLPQTSHLTQEMERKVTWIVEETLGRIATPPEAVSLFICGENTIQDLNKRFRGVDRPTDILSFEPETENDPEFTQGELALCLSICQNQAEEYGLSLTEELARLLVHGILHLVGLDHLNQKEEEEMLRREIEILGELGFKQIY